MKALTVCQPYAELIARGEKLIENRDWPTRYRGPLAIHAGKSKSWLDDGDADRYPDMAFGAVVAIARLIECVKIEDLPEDYLGQREHLNGPWCWVLADVQRVGPFAAKGALGVWDWSDVRPTPHAEPHP